jgi:hypothetical protein
VKENLYSTGHEEMEIWELSYHERLGKKKRLLGQLFDFFKCFVNCAYISNWLFVF